MPDKHFFAICNKDNQGYRSTLCLYLCPSTAHLNAVFHPTCTMAPRTVSINIYNKGARLPN